MAPRSTWKGYLKISLVSVPVRAYTGSRGGAKAISFNQLHEECHSRIRYKKFCPVHGEVPKEEIVSGYEYTKGQYVVIDSSELDKLRSEGDRSLNVDAFVPADAVDPIYLTGKTYYLLPDGPVGQKPYQLVQQAMALDNLHAIAWIILSNREQIVRLRPLEDLLAMDILEYQTQVTDPGTFQAELVETKSSAQETKLTRQLIGALAKDAFDPSEYKDLYTERLTQLIEARVQGEELVTPPAAQEPQVVNLMEALKQSVQQTKSKPSKPPRKKSPSAKKSTATKKKKVGKKKKSG